MQIKNLLVKLWYEMPRFKLIIKLQRKHVDDRAFDWYLSRQKYGFDERILWNLSSYNDDRIRKSLRLTPSTQDYISLGYFSMWIRNPEYKEDVIWFCERVCKYIEWECPYSYYENGHLYTSVEIEKILAQYKDTIKAAANRMIMSDSEIEFLHKYDRFSY